MTRSRRRLAVLLLGLLLTVLASAFLYMWGMAALEGKPASFWHSLEWAAETLTTTGYGADSPVAPPGDGALVVAVQFLGVFLVFLIFPIYLIPFLEERFETRLPQEVAKDLAGHVVVYRYGPAVETPARRSWPAPAVPTLVLEQDDAVARRLFESGVRVVHRGLDEGALHAARLERARAIIANGSDDENAALSLSARQLGFRGTDPGPGRGPLPPPADGCSPAPRPSSPRATSWARRSPPAPPPASTRGWAASSSSGGTWRWPRCG